MEQGDGQTITGFGIAGLRLVALIVENDAGIQFKWSLPDDLIRGDVMYVITIEPYEGTSVVLEPIVGE